MCFDPFAKPLDNNINVSKNRNQDSSKSNNSEPYSTKIDKNQSYHPTNSNIFQAAHNDSNKENLISSLWQKSVNITMGNMPNISFNNKTSSANLVSYTYPNIKIKSSWNSRSKDIINSHISKTKNIIHDTFNWSHNNENWFRNWLAISLILFVIIKISGSCALFLLQSYELNRTNATNSGFLLTLSNNINLYHNLYLVNNIHNYASWFLTAWLIIAQYFALFSKKLSWRHIAYGATISASYLIIAKLSPSADDLRNIYNIIFHDLFFLLVSIYFWRIHINSKNSVHNAHKRDDTTNRPDILLEYSTRKLFKNNIIQLFFTINIVFTIIIAIWLFGYQASLTNYFGEIFVLWHSSEQLVLLVAYLIAIIMFALSRYFSNINFIPYELNRSSRLVIYSLSIILLLNFITEHNINNIYTIAHVIISEACGFIILSLLIFNINKLRLSDY